MITLPITSITRGPRQSNMEMLRILAMFLVLAVHADFFSLHPPVPEDFQAAFVPSVTRVFLECVSVICVNAFVLISGWFSIKVSWRGLCNFLFQCFYFVIVLYIVGIVTGHASFSIVALGKRLMLYDIGWFVRAYLGLYILAPVLNAFVRQASRSQLELFLIGFFLFQTLYGWVTGCARFIEQGYSTFSFIGLYLLARYLNLYKSITYKSGGYFCLWDC